MDQALIQRPVAGRASLPWLASIAATLALILLVNPVGFVGGGMDDWQYLNAARCWAAHGACLPHDHWQGRWPVIAPLAATIAVLGESRLTIGLPSLAYAIGCLYLLARLGNRLAGRPVGFVAALILLVMPIFGVELLAPNAELPELFFLLAAANFVFAYSERRDGWHAFAAGICFSLAFQVRETAIAALPLLTLAAWTLARRDLRALLAALAGAALPLAAEWLVFHAATGDGLWRRHLSMAHTEIPSTELVGPVDHSRSPFFNPDYIAGWKQQPGIHIHWSVDGLVNLLANVMAGIGIPCSILFAAVYWRRLGPGERRNVGWSIAAALHWACVLIYALAVDPKPRMMFVPVALTAFALAILIRRLVRTRSASIGYAILATCWAVGISQILAYPQLRTSEAAASRWAEQYPGRIETDETTRRHLALTAASSSFGELSSDRPMLAIKLDLECRKWADRHFSGKLQPVGRSAFSPMDRFQPGAGANLCLFRYRAPLSPAEIMRARASNRSR